MAGAGKLPESRRLAKQNLGEKTQDLNRCQDASPAGFLPTHGRKHPFSLDLLPLHVQVEDAIRRAVAIGQLDHGINPNLGLRGVTGDDDIVHLGRLEGNPLGALAAMV